MTYQISSLAFAVLTLLLAWNEFFFAYLFLVSEHRYTLSIGMYSFIQEFTTQWGNIMAAGTLTSIPVLMFFFLLQRATARGNGRFDGGVAATEELLRGGVEFTAILAFNDLMAIGAISAHHRAGRRVPDDVSIVGFDDIFVAAAVFPPLTTAAQPVSEMGRRSVEFLLNRIGDRDAPVARIVLPTTFVARESCRAIGSGTGVRP